MKTAKRLLRVLVGVSLYGLGVYLSIQANIGLAPWEAFHSGVSIVSGMSFGDVSVAAGLIILLVDVLLKEKIGLGTVLNTIIVGKVVDLLQALGPLPKAGNTLAGIAVLLLGQTVICYATYLYISAGMGSGPRDSLMVALGKRLPRAPIGVIKGLIEGTVLLIGWALGAKIGLGTVISVVSISLILQWIFDALRFKVRDVRHESVLETLRSLRKPAMRPDA